MSVGIVHILKIIQIHHKKTTRGIRILLRQIFIDQRFSGKVVIKSGQGISLRLFFQNLFSLSVFRDILQTAGDLLSSPFNRKSIHLHTFIGFPLAQAHFHRPPQASLQKFPYFPYILRMYS